jgi:hypothetical protein
MTVVGNKVSSISSRPESNRDIALVQASDALRPTLASDCLVFAGAQIMRDVARSIYNGFPSTAFGVFTVSGVPGVGARYIMQSYDLPNPTSAVDSTSVNMFNDGVNPTVLQGSHEQISASTPYTTLDTKAVFRFEMTATTLEIMINSDENTRVVLVGTRNANPNASAIGGEGSGQAYHHGKICEILQYDRLLTPDEASRVEASLIHNHSIVV